jgi:hypothetical protein
MGRLKSDVESAREIELRLKDTFQMKDAEIGMDAPHLERATGRNNYIAAGATGIWLHR